MIHAYLIHAPATAEQLAKTLGVEKVQRVKAAVCRMAAEGRIQITGVGTHPDTKRPRYVYEATAENMTLTTKVVLALIQHGPMGTADIAEELDWTQGGVQTTLARLQGAGRVRITGWVRNDTARYVALYGLGSGRDAPKPKPFTNSERLVRYRQRQKTRTPSAFDRPTV